MTFRKRGVLFAALVITILLLALTGPYTAAGSPPSPRENPAFQDLLSGVVVVEPGAASGVGPGAVASVPLGMNVLCNQDPGVEPQNEPSIVVNPLDSAHVIASSNDYRLRESGGDVHPGYYASFDGGLTWPGDGVIDLSSIPQAEAGGDPALAIHDLNNVYFAYIAFHRTIDDVGGVYVSKSTDGGLSWAAPVGVAYNTQSVFHDKEYITVDATGGPYDGYVYVSWTRFEFSSPIYFSRSTDGGATFSTPMEISDTSYSSNQGSIPAVGPNGEVYVVWYNYNTGGQRMAVSLDGGATFGTPFPVASVNAIPSPLPGGNFRVNSFPTQAIDQNTGNLYVAWNDYVNGDADIYFVRSVDDGQNWSSPMRINDDPLGNDYHQFFPWLTVAPDGDVYIGWFDSRHDPDPYTTPFYYDEYVAVSADEGLTFSPNARISTVSADSSTDFDGQFIGDYSGIAATEDFVYPAWVDTRRGNQDIFTQNGLVSGEKFAPGTVDQGQVFRYIIVLSSTMTITDNVLSDPLPAEVTYVPGSLGAGSGSYGQEGGVITWTGTLTGGQLMTITFEVTATAPSCTPVTNTAILTAGVGDQPFQLAAYTYISGTRPTAAFVPSDLMPDVGELVTFTNLSTGSLPLDFVWDLGDGMTSTLPAPEHAYSLPGPYTVTLTAANGCGEDTHADTLTVVCADPTAAFTWTAKYLVVTFTNESTGTFPLDFVWDLGDGMTSTLPAPTHTYGAPGPYTVTLSATDLCGTGIYSDLVQVTQQPHHYYLYLPVVIKN
jgi:uncharacterized repeat protein (TIGR01451 family)